MTELIRKEHTEEQDWVRSEKVKEARVKQRQNQSIMGTARVLSTIRPRPQTLGACSGLERMSS